jgi:hypothetical protein
VQRGRGARSLARYLRRRRELALRCLGRLGTLEPAEPPIYREGDELS